MNRTLCLYFICCGGMLLGCDDGSGTQSRSTRSVTDNASPSSRSDVNSASSQSDVRLGEEGTSNATGA